MIPTAQLNITLFVSAAAAQAFADQAFGPNTRHNVLVFAPGALRLSNQTPAGPQALPLPPLPAGGARWAVVSWA